MNTANNANTATTMAALRPLADIMGQYAGIWAEAQNWAVNGNLTCAALNVLEYGLEIEEDYAELVKLAAQADRLAARIADARGEYKAYLQEQHFEVLYALHATAGNPGANNCGIRWF